MRYGPRQHGEHATYSDFIAAKIAAAPTFGEPIDIGKVNPILKPHQAALVRWAVERGRAAFFCKFGLGKTLMQLETVRLSLDPFEGRGLIVIPLGVRQEFIRDAAMLGVPVRFIRSTTELADGDLGIFLTNYESVREGKIDTARFDTVSLDEAAVLRGFGGTKTFREFMRLFDETPRRFVATATPSPNEYIELLSYAAFLGVIDVGEGKTRFFKRNSEKADALTLHPHKEEEFWLWVNSWAAVVQRPSDLGFSDDGYELPLLEVRWHEVQADIRGKGEEWNGQHILLRDASLGVQQAAAEKRQTLDARVACAAAIVAAAPDDHFILWHDLEDERKALEAAIPGVVSVYGSQDLDARETAIIGFADGDIRLLAAKPVMLGSGANFQRHCHRAIFVGVGFKFAEFIQAIHRIQRFLQPHPVIIDIIHAETERETVRLLMRKWAQHDDMAGRMSAIIRDYGLNAVAAQERLKRSIGCERVVREGVGWRAVNADCVEETAAMDADSVGLILTSIPFGTQYEYSPSYNDFGHTDDDRHFWRQMDWLSPELLRVLQPGRVFACHVKDRVRPGGLDGVSFQTISPFHADAIQHYRSHGFHYMGMITVVTDVVRENSQTYRLGWTEQCKDGAKMSAGLPEYILLFRKAPTDSANGYADVRVTKDKEAYTRARWQFDAHGYWRSKGDRLVTPEDFDGLTHSEVFQAFKAWSASAVHDHELMVAIAQRLEERGMLPPGFMLCQPASHHPDVWDDVTRMRTLNGEQQAKGREMHLCPMQFDIADRIVTRFSNPGETVFDPFGGLMTVPLRAMKLGRIGWGCELSPAYFGDGVRFLEAAERELAIPSLFDLIGGAEPVREVA